MARKKKTRTSRSKRTSVNEQAHRDLQAFLAENPADSPDELRDAIAGWVEQYNAKVSAEGPARPRRGASAQDLVYAAMEESDPERRMDLLNEILELDPKNVEALIMLAEHAESVGFDLGALEIYERAIDVAEEALGPEFFAENEGYFWGLIETRPYMRALQGYAFALESEGQLGMAIELYQTMLRLNPADNQGARRLLASALMKAGRWEEAEAALANTQDDPLCHNAYDSALIEFFFRKDEVRARKLLQTAIQKNPHVPALMFQEDAGEIPEEPPAYVSPGSREEGISYVMAAFPLWRFLPGAMDWLERVHLSGKTGKPARKAASTGAKSTGAPTKKKKSAARASKKGKRK